MNLEKNYLHNVLTVLLTEIKERRWQPLILVQSSYLSVSCCWCF